MATMVWSMKVIDTAKSIAANAMFSRIYPVLLRVPRSTSAIRPSPECAPGTPLPVGIIPLGDGPAPGSRAYHHRLVGLWSSLVVAQPTAR